MTTAPGILLALLVAGQAPAPEERAVAFLAREVPRWSAENHCFSCHNNGDAARALYHSARAGMAVPEKALRDTSDWLAHPGRWDDNKGDRPYVDKGLARVQFAAALVEALDAGLVKERATLARAAELVAEGQRPEGSWRLDAADSLGSPATYGTCLATHLARQTLLRADVRRYRSAVEKADRWLRQVAVKTVLDAAAVLVALEGAGDADALAQRRRCWDLIRRGESSEGGWGPYVNSSPEPFDTAVVLLALARFPDEPGGTAMLRRGRAYLIAAQEADGSWPATTRPPGARSYAQHLSTTGWATLALLATR